MKVGLALGGGGSKGSYQVGVLKALLEENLLDNLKVVSGTSIGALNACLVMEKQNFDQMYDLWSRINNDILYRLSNNRFLHDRLGLFNQGTMYEVLISKQPKEVIHNSPIDGFVTATKIKEYGIRQQLKQEFMEGEIIHLNKAKDPHKFVLASASVPIVFGPTEIDGEFYVDGGLFDNLPVNILIENGCNTIITVGLNPNHDLNPYIENNDKLIIDFSPIRKLTFSILGMLDFDQKQMDKRIDLGYENAKLLIEKLKEEKVIINGKWNSDIKGLYQLKDEELFIEQK